MNGSKISVSKLVVIPSLITLGVTMLRLVGELNNWHPLFFSREAGGGGAIVGIVWLAFVFAVWFAVKLQRAGDVFSRSGKAIGLNLGALLLCIAGAVLMVFDMQFRFGLYQAAGILVVLAALWVMRMAWPAYWNIMIVYGLAARIPVIVVMYLAIMGDWGTHYDAPPPDVLFDDKMTEFVQAGLLPQLFIWVPFTVIICGLLGVITAAVLNRRKPGAAAV